MGDKALLTGVDRDRHTVRTDRRITRRRCGDRLIERCRSVAARRPEPALSGCDCEAFRQHLSSYIVGVDDTATGVDQHDCGGQPVERVLQTGEASGCLFDQAADQRRAPNVRHKEPHPLARMLELSVVFMALTFTVFVGYGLFAAAIRSHVILRPSVLAWMRRSFAAAFAALGAKLAFADR